MTSKTFNCVEHEEEALEVYPFTGEEGGRKFSLLMPHVSSHAGIAFDSTTAPALALATLEAAGYEERQKGWDVLNSADENFAQAMRCLSKGLALQERATAEAEAQAKLEAEALELCNEYVRSADGKPYDSWEEVVRVSKHMAENWLAVARRAREMRAEK